MNRLSRRARILCLLALLQVLGGPLVLVGVVALGELMVKETVEHGLVAGVSQVLQSGEWQAACDELNAVVNDAPATKAPTKAPKGKEGKAASPSLAWSGGLNLFEVFLRENSPDDDPVRLMSAWPNGPPVPPPRWV